MNRRKMMGALGLGAATFAVGTTARADDKHDHGHEHDEHLELMARCAKICHEAARHCLDMLCEGEGDLKHHARAHAIAADCAAFCTLTASLMASCSEITGHAHEANAKVCAACAEVCEKSDDKHEIMKKCAEICRECEKACAEMAKMDHSAHHDHS